MSEQRDDIGDLVRVACEKKLSPSFEIAVSSIAKIVINRIEKIETDDAIGGELSQRISTRDATIGMDLNLADEHRAVDGASARLLRVPRKPRRTAHFSRFQKQLAVARRLRELIVNGI